MSNRNTAYPFDQAGVSNRSTDICPARALRQAQLERWEAVDVQLLRGVLTLRPNRPIRSSPHLLALPPPLPELSVCF